MRWKIPFLVCLCLIVVPAFADNSADHTTLQQELHSFGVNETIDWNVKPRKVAIYLDQQRVISSIPNMQEMGLLNPDITQTTINLYPNAISITVATEMAVLKTIDAYSHSGIDEAVFSISLVVSDEYGHEQTKPLFSYRFNRALNNRINWDNFQIGNLPKVALGFRYSNWAMQNMEGFDK